MLVQVCGFWTKCVCTCSLGCDKCVLASHHTLSALAFSRMWGERSGQGQLWPFHLCGTVSSFGQGKQTCLAPRARWARRVASAGQGAKLGTGQNGTAPPLIDAAQFGFRTPENWDNYKQRRAMANWAKGHPLKAFHLSAQNPHMHTERSFKYLTLLFSEYISTLVFWIVQKRWTSASDFCLFCFKYDKIIKHSLSQHFSAEHLMRCKLQKPQRFILITKLQNHRKQQDSQTPEIRKMNNPILDLWFISFFIWPVYFPGLLCII